MADTNKLRAKEESDGTGKTEVGVPKYTRPLMQSQGQHDTLKVEAITLELANGASDLTYPTKGFPLADNAGTEVTPDDDTPTEHYKFSAFLAQQLRRRPDDGLQIVSVELEGASTGDGEQIFCRYDAVKDKVRLWSLVDGIELVKGDAILSEDSTKELRLRVVIL